MSYKTNRKTKGTFRVRNPSSMGMAEYGRGMKSVKGYQLIKEKAERIDKIEPLGSFYVEDGEGQRYRVTMGDGRTSEVEFIDSYSRESYDEEGEPEGGEVRNISVIWDGAVDFDRSYDANSEKDKASARKELIARYGKLAKEFL